jgi:signal peptide peptidase SppA
MHFTRESVFVGAIRSFCSSFAVILGLSLGVTAIFIGMMMMGGPNYLPPKSDFMIMPDSQGNRSILSAEAPVILRIDIRGVIGMGDLTAEKIQNILLGSQEDMLKDKRVKGVLLVMDSPGGFASEADAIYRALMDYKTKYKLPIYTYVDGMCASGGMYVACASDKIYATPGSVIGSVGVRMGPTFNFSDAMTKVGVSALTITAGKDKDEMNPFRPWKPDEAASIQTIVSALYDQFITIVATARPRLTKEKLIHEYGADVFIAQTAENFGYIDDARSDYAMSLMALSDAAGIGKEQPYQVVQLSPPQPFLSGLTQSIFKQGKIVHALDLPPQMSPELSGKLLYLYQP